MHPIFEYFDTRSEETKELEEQLDKVRAALITSIYAHQLKCEHKHIAEAPWEQSQWSSSTPEERICLHCGLSEIGWGIGFQTLKHKYPVSITRDDLRQLWRGMRLTEEKKCRILRKEFTLTDLIREECDQRLKNL